MRAIEEMESSKWWNEAALAWTQVTGYVRARLLASLALVVVASALTALSPLALKSIVDHLTGGPQDAAFALGMLVALYVLAQWLSRGLVELRVLAYAYAERRVHRIVTERVVEHVMRLPLRAHMSTQTGAITQTLQNGSQGCQMIAHQLVFTLFPGIVELTTVIVVLVQFEQPMFVALYAAAAVCYATAFATASVQSAEAARSAAAMEVGTQAVMTDCILNYETIKSFTAERAVQNRVSDALAQTELHWLRYYNKYTFGRLAAATIYGVFSAIMILYALEQMRQGNLTIGGFVLVNTYMLQLIRPIEMLGGSLQSLSQAAALLTNMRALLREGVEPSGGDDVPAKPEAASLEFQSVSASLCQGRRILQHVTFAVPAGKTLAIVGATGAGKSTIARLAIRLHEPDSGRIALDGVPITLLSPHSVRDAIGVVAQDTILFNDTIRNNIAIGKPGATEAEIVEAAKFAQLHDLVVTWPAGYDTIVGERGTRLSGGERQKVAIARVVLKQPRIYLFDEATSALDSQTEGEILRRLRANADSRTIVLIAHRLQTVMTADEIIVLSDGMIVERGTHSELLCIQGHYSQLWQKQQQPSVPKQRNEWRSEDDGAVYLHTRERRDI